MSDTACPQCGKELVTETSTAWPSCDCGWPHNTPRTRHEEAAARTLADAIGYGRLMQLCEKLWREKLALEGREGGEHTQYCCATFMVPCPADHDPHCDWCCGAGRVTKRVAEAIEESR